MIPKSSITCPECGDPDPFTEGQLDIQSEASVIVDNQSSTTSPPEDVSTEDQPSDMQKPKARRLNEKKGIPKSCYWLAAAFMLFAITSARAVVGNISSYGLTAHEFGMKVAITNLSIIFVGTSIGATLGYFIDRSIESKNIRIGSYTGAIILAFLISGVIQEL